MVNQSRPVIGETYPIQSPYSSKYFLEKYGTENPLITIEGLAEKLLGKQWAEKRIPGVIVFLARRRLNFSPATVYYGKIDGIGELVGLDELEGVEES